MPGLKTLGASVISIIAIEKEEGEEWGIHYGWRGGRDGIETYRGIPPQCERLLQCAAPGRGAPRRTP
jgi:hypothetical protein